MIHKANKINHTALGNSLNKHRILILLIAAALCLVSTGLGAAEEVNLTLKLGDMDDGEYFIKQTIPITAMYFNEDNGTPIIEANISFHIYDINNFGLYLYAHTDSNGFATVYFVPEEAGEYIIDASVVAEINNFERQYLLVEPFIHSYKEYIFPPNTIQTVKYTLIDEDLNPIENVINFQFGSINDNILPFGGTIEYSINSSNFGQDIELNNSFSGYVNPTEYIIDVTNRYIDINPGITISYFMRVFDTNNAPTKNTNFTIVVDWWNENDENVDETIFNVTTNNYGLSEFEITVPSGVSEGEFAINKQSDFEEGLYASFYGSMYVDEPGSELHFDIDTSDWDPNYNEEVIITFQLHNSSKYFANIPIYLYVNGSSVKLITDSNGEASFAFTPPAKLGNNMIYAMTYISEEGGLWHDDDDFFVSPAEPHIGLSLNRNVVDINVNMMDNSSNLIPNSPAIFEFVRTPNEHWLGTYEDVLSKYINPTNGTYTDQIILNKYGRYEGYVGWGWYYWYDAVYYTPFEYSTNLESVFSSGQDNYININVMKNGIPLTSGNVYLKCYLEDAEIDIHDFVPIDSNGNAVLTFSPPSNEDEVHITIGVSTEIETYDLLDTWIALEPSTTIRTPVHNINKGTNYTTIQAAIDDASPGDEIHVDSGTYYENVVVNKQLILLGEDNFATIIDGNEGEKVVEVIANEVVIEGFRIQNGSIGIYVTSSYNTLIGNMALKNSAGIYLIFSNNNTLSGNTASNNSQYGILLYSSNTTTLSSNTASNNSQHGILLYSSSNKNTLSSNTASNNDYGIYLDFSSNNTLYHNNLINNIKNAFETATNQWNSDSGGNYYSDYGGIDADGDGIGDTPYNISSGTGSQDLYPLMQPWNVSGSEFISIGSANAPTNSTVTILVSVANVNNISGISFDLLCNSSVVSVSSVSANDSFTGSSIILNIDNANGITSIVLTNSNLISASAETTVIDIAFNVTGGFGSSTSLNLQNVEFRDAEFNPYPPAVVVDGQIKVGIKGDFNGNDRVDIGDVAKVAFMVAGKVPEDPNADFNENGRVDIGDAAKIAFYLAGKVSEL